MLLQLNELTTHSFIVRCPQRRDEENGLRTTRKVYSTKGHTESLVSDLEKQESRDRAIAINPIALKES